MKDTGAVGRNAAMNPRMPMQAEIYNYIVKNGPRDCYQLEDELPGPHQTVSGAITKLVQGGHLIIEPYTHVNKFGNEVRVYRAGEPFVPKRGAKRA